MVLSLVCKYRDSMKTLLFNFSFRFIFHLCRTLYDIFNLFFNIFEIVEFQGGFVSEFLGQTAFLIISIFTGVLCMLSTYFFICSIWWSFIVKYDYQMDFNFLVFCIFKSLLYFAIILFTFIFVKFVLAAIDCDQ